MLCVVTVQWGVKEQVQFFSILRSDKSGNIYTRFHPSNYSFYVVEEKRYVKYFTVCFLCFHCVETIMLDLLLTRTKHIIVTKMQNLYCKKLFPHLLL